MEKRSLHNYLSRLSQGESSLRELVCAELTRATVYVPTDRPFQSLQPQQNLQKICSNGSNHYPYENTAPAVIQVAVKSCLLSDGPVVPIFSSQKSFKGWCSIALHAPSHVIALLAGDLCLTLPSDFSLLVDPGTPWSTRFLPSDLKLIGDPNSARGFAPPTPPGAKSWTTPPPQRTRAHTAIGASPPPTRPVPFRATEQRAVTKIARTKKSSSLNLTFQLFLADLRTRLYTLLKQIHVT